MAQNVLRRYLQTIRCHALQYASTERHHTSLHKTVDGAALLDLSRLFLLPQIPKNDHTWKHIWQEYGLNYALKYVCKLLCSTEGFHTSDCNQKNQTIMNLQHLYYLTQCFLHMQFFNRLVERNFLKGKKSSTENVNIGFNNKDSNVIRET